MQAELNVIKANQQLLLQSVEDERRKAEIDRKNAENDRKMMYAVLLAATGICGYCFLSNGRLVPGSIIFKFTLTCFTDYTEDEIIELLNNYFRGGKEVYYKDFEATVDLINDTIIGK